MTLGAQVRTLRKARGLTQRALAGPDRSVSFISMLEHDRVRPSLATLRLLAERLAVPLTTLLEDQNESPAEAEARLRHGDVLLRQHQFTPALEQYEFALAIAERAGDDRLRAQAHLGLGQVLLGLRQFALAESHLEQAETRGEQLDPRFQALAANARGLLAIRQRAFSRALSYLTRGLTAIRQAQPLDRGVEATILGNLGRAYTSLALPMQALVCYEEARPALEAAADSTGLALLHLNSGVAYIQQRSFDDAARRLHQAAELLQVQENLQLLGSVKRSLGILMLDRGDAADAEPLLRQSLAIAERMADDAGQAQTLTELGRAALAQDRMSEAGRHAEAALRLATRVQDPAETARAHLVLGGVARGRTDLDESASHYREAAEAFRRLEMLKEAGEALRELGFVYLDAGKEGEAAHAFAQAFRAQDVGAAADR